MKKYILTNTEIEAIRNALIKYDQEIKYQNLTPLSHHVKELFKAVETLKHRFMDDFTLIK